MKITQIRSATVIVEYAGKRFLVDPMLADQGTTPPFGNDENDQRRNPLVALPLPLDEIIDVDSVIVTHTHRDHWDEAAARLLPKHLPIFVQNRKDEIDIRANGFGDVRLLSDGSAFEDIGLVKTPGQHGSDAVMHKIGARLGEVCGVVFKHADEKTAYLVGDTVWNAYVDASLRKHAPDVVIVNCGDAQIAGVGSIIMGKHDVHEVLKAAPKAVVVATHMEAVNHAKLTRRELREFIAERNVAHRLLIPADGESIVV